MHEMAYHAKGYAVMSDEAAQTDARSLTMASGGTNGYLSEADSASSRPSASRSGRGATSAPHPRFYTVGLLRDRPALLFASLTAYAPRTAILILDVAPAARRLPRVLRGAGWLGEAA